jgi:hypothetical protein
VWRTFLNESFGLEWAPVVPGFLHQGRMEVGVRNDWQLKWLDV